MKSLVVEEIPDPNSIKSEDHTAKSQETTSFAGNSISTTAVGLVDPKIKEQLLATLNEKSPKTWTELHNQITTLKTVLPDEISAYKAALALFAKNGVSHDQVLQDISSVIDILDGQKLEFDSECERQLSQKVGARQKNLADLTAKIKEHEAQIAVLTSQQSEETAAIAVGTNKIAKTQANFLVAYNVVHKELIDEKNKISAYGAK